MLKKTLITSLVGFVVLFVSINARAATFTYGQIVDANKNWTIHFNQEVEFDNLTKQGITVEDSKGNLANVIVSLGEDDKTLIVNAPKEGYTSGEKYTLNIGNKVHSKKNKNVKQTIAFNFGIKDKDNIVKFNDKIFENAVRSIIGKTSGDIYKSDVDKITDLNLKHGYDIPCGDGPAQLKKDAIFNIDGIENFTSLKNLNLCNNEISDISKLSELSNLQNIDLSQNKIKDISSLKGLSSLQSLDLFGDEISDINALKDLTSLQKLNLNSNEIYDISSLKELTNLQNLDLGGTQVNDISALKNLTNLQNLELGGIQVDDISALKDLTNLQSLGLGETQISDLNSLKNLSKLQTLMLYDTKISDISPLKGLVNLQTLYLDDTQISNISVLKEIPNLKTLTLGNAQERDVNALKDLTNLKSLCLVGIRISDSSIQELKEALPECDIFRN